MKEIALEAWHQIAKTQDTSRLPAILSPDVLLESPVVRTPTRSRGCSSVFKMRS